MLFEKSSYKHMKIEPWFEGVGTDKGKNLIVKWIEDEDDLINVIGQVSG